jgi:hypothetical protein
VRGRVFVVVAERPGRPVVDHAGRAEVGAAGVNVRDDERVSPVLEGGRAVTRDLELLAGTFSSA